MSFLLKLGRHRIFSSIGHARRANGAVLTVLLMGLVLSGCASLEGKVTSSKVADTSFFADQTISMLSSADINLNKDNAIYTREFFDANDPDEKKLLEFQDKVMDVFRVVIEYSLAIVRIAESRKPEADQVQMYADWFGPWDDLTFEQLSMDQTQYDQVVASIREAKDLRGAFLTAQPMLNALNLHMNQVLDEMEKVADVVAANIDARIDAEFADVIAYQEALEEEKYSILSALGDGYMVFRGDKGAYEKLKENGAIRRKDLLPSGWPSDEELTKVAEHLMKRLEAMHLIGKQIQPEWDVYRATHKELDELHARLNEDLKTMRIIMLVWVHAHYQMGSGRSRPAEWFDIQDTGTAALKLLF